jgi:nickel-dependent lactate racemase
MGMKIDLPYGRRPISVELGDRDVQIVAPRPLPPPPDVRTLIEAALDDEAANGAIAGSTGAPASRVLAAVAPGSRVTIIVSDPTRDEPRELFIAALRKRLPSNIQLTLAVATGTHGPCNVDALGLSAATLRDVTLINHNGHRADDDDGLVEVGVTTRGTPIRVHRCVVESDLVIATGCIRPHYFAGFGAGIKAIFPGLGQATAIRINHRLKTEPNARAGVTVGNPCREDLEEAATLLATPKLLLNGVCGPDGLIHAAVAGDVVTAFRRGADLARPWFTVRARPSPLVIASDVLPVTASLYQTAKIAAAVAPLIEVDGTLVLAAECTDGTGPLETVNEAIFRIGVLPRLPSGTRIILVSSLDEKVVRQTLVEYSSTLDPFIASASRITVVPRASQLLCEPTP